jgi:hypothetical protein
VLLGSLEEVEQGDRVGARRARVRRSLPLIVLDEDRVPIGILER